MAAAPARRRPIEPRVARSASGRGAIVAALVVITLTACAGADDGGAPTPTAASETTTTSTSTTSTTTTSTSTTSTSTTSTTNTPTTTTTPDTTSTTLAPDDEADGADQLEEVVGLDVGDAVDTIEIGRSVEDREIVVHRHGDPSGMPVLVIGVIHGNEPEGFRISEALLAEPAPDGVELWVVPTMNPDGLLASDRRNANGVDLNRNFPERWDVLGEPGDWQYGGPAPASEPETRAMLDLGEIVDPELVLWYHQDLFRIHPASGRDGAVRERYAGLTGLPIIEVTGGTYTGTASTWSRTITSPTGVGFTIELGASLDDDEVGLHAEAVRIVASEMATGSL